MQKKQAHWKCKGRFSLRPIRDPPVSGNPAPRKTDPKGPVKEIEVIDLEEEESRFEFVESNILDLTDQMQLEDNGLPLYHGEKLRETQRTGNLFLSLSGDEKPEQRSVRRRMQNTTRLPNIITPHVAFQNFTTNFDTLPGQTIQFLKKIVGNGATQYTVHIAIDECTSNGNWHM